MKRKRVNIRRVIICLTMLVFIIYLSSRFTMSLIYNNNYAERTNSSIINNIFATSQYDIIKEDNNDEYAGKRTRKSIQ